MFRIVCRLKSKALTWPLGQTYFWEDRWKKLKGAGVGVIVGVIMGVNWAGSFFNLRSSFLISSSVSSKFFFWSSSIFLVKPLFPVLADDDLVHFVDFLLEVDGFPADFAVLLFELLPELLLGFGAFLESQAVLFPSPQALLELLVAALECFVLRLEPLDLQLEVLDSDSQVAAFAQGLFAQLQLVLDFEPVLLNRVHFPEHSAGEPTCTRSPVSLFFCAEPAPHSSFRRTSTRALGAAA